MSLHGYEGYEHILFKEISMDQIVSGGLKLHLV